MQHIIMITIIIHGIAANVGDFVARCVGVLGNSLKVSVCASASAFSQSNVTTINDGALASLK